MRRSPQQCRGRSTHIALNGAQSRCGAKAGEQFPDDGGNKMTKSDSELRHDVERELEWDPSIDARNIGVMVKNGVVTLTGTVSTYSDKWRAERIAKRVAGVTALANDVEVKLTNERTDSDIAEAARA